MKVYLIYLLSFFMIAEANFRHNDINSFLGKSEIEEIFDINYHYKNLNSIFKKVFK